MSGYEKLQWFLGFEFEIFLAVKLVFGVFITNFEFSRALRILIKQESTF